MNKAIQSKIEKYEIQAIGIAVIARHQINQDIERLYKRGKDPRKIIPLKWNLPVEEKNEKIISIHKKCVRFSKLILQIIHLSLHGTEFNLSINRQNKMFYKDNIYDKQIKEHIELLNKMDVKSKELEKEYRSLITFYSRAFLGILIWYQNYVNKNYNSFDPNDYSFKNVEYLKFYYKKSFK